MAGGNKAVIRLANDGSTGNNTHNAVHIGATYDTVLAIFEITAVGATPTVTFKFQGIFDVKPVLPNNSGILGGESASPSTDLSTATNWFDMGYVTDAADTYAVATQTKTAVGRFHTFFKRPAEFVRLVTSANTNVTYRAYAVLIQAP